MTVRALLGRMAAWLVNHRASLPRWVNRMLEAPARNPDGLIGRIALRALGGGASDAVALAPDAPVRVLIGPANYSGQAYRWARALEAADPSLGARNVAEDIPGGFAFPADTLVPFATTQGSRAWADAEWQAAQGFTHVLVEAERPLFGRRFDRDPAAEFEAMREAGIDVAYLCHGTDIRDPAAHAARTPWSPYPDDPRTDYLATDAAKNLALLTRLGRPTFVSTPDLLDDVPWAVWCPVVVDAERFATEAPVGRGGALTIVHASSNPVQKGSDLIAPALASLIADGAVELRLIEGVPSAQMPSVFAAADIVIDQFRLGSYGVAACEAMASGRVVIGHVLPHVRAHVRQATGFELPIVEATPETLAEVVSRFVADPGALRAAAAAGPRFVRAVHTGSRSARALIDHWVRGADAPAA